MRNWFILFLVGILTINIVSAELIITPSTMNITTIVNEQKNFNLTLKNTFDFQIKSFQFSNLTGFTFPTIILEPAQEKTITFNVKRTSSIMQTINSKVSFNYLVNLPIGIKTHQVNITENGYKPAFIVIRQGDTIQWTNTDDITHTVTSTLFDYNLPVNQSISQVFNTIGTIPYNDLVIFYTGTIEVIDASAPEEVHNPTYDKNLIINLDVTLNPTQLKASTLKTNYTVDAVGSTEGLLEIENTGSEVAERIKLTSTDGWISFDENDFNLEKGTTNFVTYKVEPRILDSAETNKTRIININIKASNSEQYTIPLNVFVPYSDIFEEFDTDEGFYTWFASTFCPTHQNLFICNTTRPDSSGEPTIIYRDSQIPVNFTTAEVYELFKRIQKMEDSGQRTDNLLNKVSSELGISIPELRSFINQSLQLQVKNEKKESSRNNTVWIIGFFILLIAIFASVFNKINKTQGQKELAEGYLPDYY